LLRPKRPQGETACVNQGHWAHRRPELRELRRVLSHHNEMVRARLGGLRSARCLMWSFDFGEIEALQRAEEWERATSLMIGAAHRLEWGGADFFLIALTPCIVPLKKSHEL
jgi:hypothetical protein